jgi:hypothetical protein
MGQDRDSTGIVNQINGGDGGHFEFWHPGGTIFFEEPLEGFIEAGTKPGLKQSPSDVRPARRLAVGQLEHRINAQRHAQAVQASDNLADAVLADLLKFPDFGQQPRMENINEVGEDVEFVLAMFGSQLAAGDKLDAGRIAGDGGSGTAFDGVVVRQGQSGEAAGLSATDQFFR